VIQAVKSTELIPKINTLFFIIAKPFVNSRLQTKSK
jgi:hypothetical protein